MAKILLIDDDTVLSKTTVRRLEKRSYNVDLIHQGVEGLRLAIDEESSYDLILLDIKIPDLNGLEVLKSIREKFEKNILPVIMVSSLEEQEDIVEALNLGANDYVTKPINIDVLIARIETQLDIKRLSNEFASKKELSAVAAMIATYNHEINNPLAIAFGTLDALQRKSEISEESFNKFDGALVRIRDIVKKIGKISSEQKLDYEDYTKKSKMIKVD